MFGVLKKMFKGENEIERRITAPVTGKAVSMQDVADPTFSQEILGKGTAVVPSEGRVVAPCDGQVTMVFDTKHAVSLQTEYGAELIIHIGLDTVQLKGQYFKAHVSAGHKVKQGDLLVEFDIDKIKEAGYDVTTPVIVCNTPEFPKLESICGMDVKAGETAIIKL
ncbi:MAG: PTS glucose transporter subunit IIA [Clostridium sp.]|nr:PTS glucose transporter subunit IIA [Clostridium sp.]